MKYLKPGQHTKSTPERNNSQEHARIANTGKKAYQHKNSAAGLKFPRCDLQSSIATLFNFVGLKCNCSSN